MFQTLYAKAPRQLGGGKETNPYLPYSFLRQFLRRIVHLKNKQTALRNKLHRLHLRSSPLTQFWSSLCAFSESEDQRHVALPTSMHQHSLYLVRAWHAWTNQPFPKASSRNQCAKHQSLPSPIQHRQKPTLHLTLPCARSATHLFLWIHYPQLHLLQISRGEGHVVVNDPRNQRGRWFALWRTEEKLYLDTGMWKHKPTMCSHNR